MYKYLLAMGKGLIYNLRWEEESVENLKFNSRNWVGYGFGDAHVMFILIINMRIFWCKKSYTGGEQHAFKCIWAGKKYRIKMDNEKNY